jgi:hypothetical protein
LTLRKLILILAQKFTNWEHGSHRIPNTAGR